jgi:nitroimidazol reductase NimA-like FMN-containing flavoprotein (pyridoxamine 5'-phosphate oxidase superfamily)
VSSKLSKAEAWFVRFERVARVATVGQDGRPFVVPVCPALDGDELVIATEEGTKIRNLRGNPRCAIVFDAYQEDWEGLRQVQIRGTAELVTEGPSWDRGKAILDEKYPQYEPIAEIVSGRTIIVRIPLEDVVSSGFD